MNRWLYVTDHARRFGYHSYIENISIGGAHLILSQWGEGEPGLDYEDGIRFYVLHR
jgi:hypothetical protein